MYVRYESSKYLVPRMFFSFLTLADLASYANVVATNDTWNYNNNLFSLIFPLEIV